MNKETSTVNDAERKDDLVSLYSDFYKEVHGIRPRWVNFDEATIEWYEEALADLRVESEAKWVLESQYEAEAIARTETTIANLIRIGAGDRLTAVRWLHEAEETNYDPEYLCFKLGVPYGYFAKENV